MMGIFLEYVDIPLKPPVLVSEEGLFRIPLSLSKATLTHYFSLKALVNPLNTSYHLITPFPRFHYFSLKIPSNTS